MTYIGVTQGKTKYYLKNSKSENIEVSAFWYYILLPIVKLRRIFK